MLYAEQSYLRYNDENYACKVWLRIFSVIMNYLIQLTITRLYMVIFCEQQL